MTMNTRFKTLPSGLKYRRDANGSIIMSGHKTMGRYHQLCKERDGIDCYKHSCFFAFSNQQFEEGKKKAHIKDGEKIYSVGAGMYGTAEGVKSFFAEMKSFNERIKEECDPQEVYFYEYNNHECMLSWDGDEEPVKLIARIWGDEAVSQIVRM